MRSIFIWGAVPLKQKNICARQPDFNTSVNCPVLQFGAPPAIDSGEAKVGTASWENVDK